MPLIGTNHSKYVQLCKGVFQTSNRFLATRKRAAAQSNCVCYMASIQLRMSYCLGCRTCLTPHGIRNSGHWLGIDVRGRLSGKRFIGSGKRIIGRRSLPGVFYLFKELLLPIVGYFEIFRPLMDNVHSITDESASASLIKMYHFS